jgi:6-phosphofructokinase 1
MNHRMVYRIGVLTSGGDAPGMNAAVRAVVRTGIYHQCEVFGIYNGYEGLITGDVRQLNTASVANIIQRGGTILKSARSEKFRTKEGRALAYETLKQHNIDSLVVIGGDGTFTGAKIFGEEYGLRIVGVPGTIDNDLYGTDFTIGFDTAINTVVEAVDKIRDTAGSHDRFFFIEVMGRDAGFIALNSGLATGAEDILVPETVTYIDELIFKIQHDRRANKSSGIIIVAEGDDAGNAFEVAQKVKDKLDVDTRVTVLGHIQRGGSPTCNDRVLASTLGYEAVIALLNGKKDCMIGQVHKHTSYTPFEKAIKQHQKLDEHLLEIARILSL